MSRALTIVLLLLAPPGLAQDAPDEQDALEAGRDLYTAKCLACHGAEAKGDGPAARALSVPTPDMTTSEFWEGMTADKLRTTITRGKPSGVMRPFKMPDDDLDALIAYLQTFRPAIDE